MRFFNLLSISGLYGILAVSLGAFGAHALKETLVEAGTLEVWKTAVFYQLSHALGLLFLALWLKQSPSERLIVACGWLWAIGILLFSGSLYWLSLGGPGWLGPITPLGGLCLIGGWALLCIMGLKKAH